MHAKSFFRIMILVLCLFGIASCTSTKKDVFVKDKDRMQKTLRIAVMPFTDAQGEYAKGSGIAISDALTNEIVKIAHWNVVERSQLEKIMNEKSMNLSGMTATDYTSIGKITKTDYIVVGSVNEFEYSRKWQNVFVPRTNLSFKARIIDAENGSIVGTVNYHKETGRYPYLGCFLGFYFIPVALLTEENKYEELDNSAQEIVSEISSQVVKKSGCLF
jgi:curli biogenesis system outer membrane secretion channel CsgG